MCIPIIFNVEAVNSQNEGFVRAARRGGVRPCNHSWKADREKLPRDSWERAPVERRQEPPRATMSHGPPPETPPRLGAAVRRPNRENRPRRLRRNAANRGAPRGDSATRRAALRARRELVRPP